MEKGNRIMIIVLVLGLSAITLGIDATGLVSYWNFDEGTGSIAHDAAGGVDGVVYGAQWVDGITGKALLFDGINDYIYLPDIVINSTEFTVAAWANHFGLGGGTDRDNPIFQQRDASLSSTIALFADKRALSRVLAMIRSHNWGPDEQYITCPMPEHNQWHHYAMTVNANDFNLYVDGKKVAGTTNMQTGNYVTSIDYVQIARSSYLSQHQGYFNGIIDDVRIFDKGLSAEEVNELYQYGVVEPNLIGLEIAGPNEVEEKSYAQYAATAVYDNNSMKDVTDEATWTVMPDDYADIDESGLLSTYELIMPTEQTTIYAQYEEGNDVVQGEKDVQIYAVCPQGSALEFDGVDDYAETPAPKNMDVQQVTIGAWVKLNEATPAINGFILNRQMTEPGTLALWTEHNDHRWKMQVRLEGSEDVDRYARSDEPINTEWTHVCGTYDGNQVKLYINGILQQEIGIANGSIDVDNPGILRIGSHPTPASYLNGTIDQLAVFNRALTNDDIQLLMYYGPDTDDPTLVASWSFDVRQGQIAHDSSGNGNDGYLGDDPCEPDSADPCWVEAGAPLHCTSRQMIVRNINGALDDKAAAAELIDSALEKEKASEKLLLDEMKEQKPRYWNPWTMWPVVEVKKSMLFEEQCRQKLQAAIEALERALDWLLNDTKATWPAKPNKSGPGKCNK